MIMEVDFSGEDWIGAIPNSQAASVRHILESGKSEEEAAEMWLSRVGSATTFGFGANGVIENFFANVRTEVVSFVCGGDKYEEERSQAKVIWEQHGKIGLVAAVAAFIAPHVGLAAAAILPVVALLFSLVGKIGINAFCRGCSTPAEV